MPIVSAPVAATPAFNGGTVTGGTTFTGATGGNPVHIEPTTDPGDVLFFIAENEDAVASQDLLAIKIKPSGGSFGDVMRVDANGRTVVKAAYTGIDPFEVGPFGVTPNPFRIDDSGAMMIGKNSAPADGNVSTNFCAFWFDNTNGLAALNFKGKTANGTVVTGTIPLT